MLHGPDVRPLPSAAAAPALLPRPAPRLPLTLRYAPPRRHQRLEKLQELRWEIGKVIPAEQKQVRRLVAPAVVARATAAC